MAEMRPVTYSTYSRKLVVVLGASGRLGGELLPHLIDETDQSAVVVGVSRSKPHTLPRGLRWQLLDLADGHYVDLATRALSGMSTVCDEVVVVDAVLDKSSVSAMRRSIAATAPFVELLASRAAIHSRPVSVILATTTAVLAPWLYQTPYGLAKRRQLIRYGHAGLSGSAFLLPTLVQADPAVGQWTFATAAKLIAEAVVADDPDKFSLVVSPRRHADDDDWRPGAALRAAPSLLVERAWRKADCPHTHRESSHALLSATPPWFRSRVDHHSVPDVLVRSFAQRHGLQTTVLSPTAAQLL